MASKFCPSCGSENDSHNQFCEGCGTTFSTSEDTSTPEASTVGSQTIPGSLEVTYASEGDRFVAFIIDSILFGLAGKVFGLLFGLPFLGSMSLDFVVDSWPVAFIGFLYLFLCEAFNGGQTLGKMAMKIKTVDSKTLGDISPAQAAVHSVGKAFFLIIDILIGAFTKEDKQNFSLEEKNTIRYLQRVSKTSVIKV